MIPVPSGVRVWLAIGHTDMRRGMNSLALQVQEKLGRDPHAGDLYVFRGKRADRESLCILWIRIRGGGERFSQRNQARRAAFGRQFPAGLSEPRPCRARPQEPATAPNA